MFEISDVKSFKDSVHGYINIPSIFVKELIDTEYFQRLRNIDQTGMRILYPDAKHDRYGHSLGVFHLGCKAVDAMLNNFSKSPYWHVSSIKTENYRFWAKNKVLFLIACLLHDIGHAPFSHSLEDLFQSQTGGEPIHIKDKFVQVMADAAADNCEKNLWSDMLDPDAKSPATHEMMGALLVMDSAMGLREHIENIFNYLISERFPRPRQDDILYAEHHNYDATVSPIDDDDLSFIARMITGIKYQEYDFEKQIKNCFIELLNGSTFDVDQLDYIMRDTQMSGINNISIDVERLLGSINIVHSVVYKEVDGLKCENRVITDLKFKQNGAPMKIDGDISGVLSIPSGYKVCIARGSTIESMSGASSHAEAINIKIDGEKPVKFDKSAYILCNGTQLIGNGITTEINQMKGAYYIENACVKDKCGFNFTVNLDARPIILSVRGHCNLTIEREKEASFSNHVEIMGNMRAQKAMISGSYSPLTILNEDIKRPPTDKMYATLSIGYHKQAMNIIANVIEARNYLYLWIYAHHKVVYYANFLLPCIAKYLANDKAVGNLVKKGGVPQTPLLYENLKLLDDSYMWTLVRRNGMNSDNGDLKKLCEELVGRRYMSSLLKSFAEFDLLFALYSESQIGNLYDRIFNSSNYIDTDKPYLEDSSSSAKNTSCMYDSCESDKDAESPNNQSEIAKIAGYLNSESIIKINKRLKEILPEKSKLSENSINAAVIVSARYKEKRLNCNSINIVMRDEVVTMDQIPSLQEKKIKTSDKNRYFYIYYDTKRSKGLFSQEEKNEFKRAVKKAFKDFFDEIVGIRRNRLRPRRAAKSSALYKYYRGAFIDRRS